MDHFVNPPETYQRNLDLVSTYISDAATYLAMQTKQPLEACEAFVKAQIAEGGPRALKVPDVMILAKDRHGDRQPRSLPMDRFLKKVNDYNLILSPSMAAYAPTTRKKSLLARYIDGNLKKRSKAKKAKFEAKMAGDKVLAANMDDRQATFKIKNNSLSGAQCSPFTILWNKSAHSTLTSTCRTATSYGNANNEKLLYGNRHYWSPDIVKANIVSILNHTDYDQLQATLREWSLRNPSIEETVALIKRSTDPYWRSEKFFAPIERLVRSMSALQRAAFCYTGDLYHLTQCNPEFTRTFIGALSTKAVEPVATIEEADERIGALDANLTAFVSILCAKELSGQTIKTCKEERPEDYRRLAATAKKIASVLDTYHSFIRTFLVTSNLPASVYSLPSIVRRGVITSDTDSTIFSTDYWTRWYVGKLDFSETSVAVANAMVYLSAQSIRHILATLSGNLGIETQYTFKLEMKNEYYFPTFTSTSRAKHYYAYIAAQEGNVYEKMDTEVKGVALRNSNVPPVIMKRAKAMMLKCMDTVMAGESISIIELLKEVASVEETIRESVNAGHYEYLSQTRINSKDAYKKPESSSYVHYELWEEVFADKYGHAPEPPYVAIKMSVVADNPTKLKAWIDTIEDRAIADRLQAFLESRSKKGVSTLLLPEAVLAMRGVPKEVICAIDIRSLIFQIMEVFYLVLESLGIYMRNTNITRLVSDSRWLLDKKRPDAEKTVASLTEPLP